MRLNYASRPRILCLYAAQDTYTATVIEHLNAFWKYSTFEWSYIDSALFTKKHSCLNYYDAIVVHYSVRLPRGDLDSVTQERLRNFHGKKLLFLQDEYENTNRTKCIMKSVKFDVVFSVVPPHSLESIYPKSEFDSTKFVNNLTGYVPDEMIKQLGDLPPASKRPITLAYRGRKLSIRYGRLGFEKISIGQKVKNYCVQNKISHDIEWDEHSRIYGKSWYEFIASAKAMLGTESGSNVFDWDGDLEQSIDRYRKRVPNASDEYIFSNIIDEHEIDGLMNQVSPKVFEMAAAKTVMVLFEGYYSGILEPWEHFFPLKKDLSNMEEAVNFLRNDALVDLMTFRAYEHIVLSNKYSYGAFVAVVDNEMKTLFDDQKISNFQTRPLEGTTSAPLKTSSPFPPWLKSLIGLRSATYVYRLMSLIWRALPNRLKFFLRKIR